MCGVALTVRSTEPQLLRSAPIDAYLHQCAMANFDAPAALLEGKKPRVLWKGCIVLHDGTFLPGVTIATHLQPWEPLAGNEDSVNEADAELCLAIQMVRHGPLRVSRIAHEMDNAAVPSEWDASGAIFACIDENAHYTYSFLERVLCSDNTLTATQPPRTRAVVSLAYDPSIVDRRSDASGALEIGILGWQSCGRTLSLVVGRAAPQRKRTAPPRPDDPLPRARTASETWASSDDEDARVLKRGNIRLTPKKSVRTPGRRGEKRRAAISAKPEPRVSHDNAWRKVADVVPPASADPPDARTEAENRSLVKRLARYQLLGRGLDKDDRDYGQIFQVAYAGTCLVFRQVIGSTALDGATVAPVVAAHLDMYMQPLALCTHT